MVDSRTEVVENASRRTLLESGIAPENVEELVELARTLEKAMRTNRERDIDE